MSNPAKTSVGTTPIEISKAGNRMRARLIRNLGAGSVFLGEDDTITSSGATQGWEVEAGEKFPDSIFSGAIWAVSASGTNDVQVWRVD
jgi:hypothetical protein